MEKVSKHDEYVEQVQKFAHYVNTQEKVVGIFATVEDSAIANRSKALKKLRSLYKYNIQMLIK